MALVKTELAKIRLAVSCPIETYLAQAWIYLVTGIAYSNWPANTLEEPLHVEVARHEETWERLRSGQYLFPYNFARFNHQPTLGGNGLTRSLNKWRTTTNSPRTSRLVTTAPC